jgi:tRNA(Ile)-lysidine synthase
VSRRGRTHPPSLLRLAERLILDEGLLHRGDLVLCACSGGPDSTALLHVLALLQPRIGHRVAAHGVDHGLRAEAAAELTRVRDLAVRLGVSFSTTRVDVAPGPNLQARARAARLAALAAAAEAQGARAIATGHTADDRAETFVLRLLRGAGPRGLAVLPPRAPLPFDPDSPAAGVQLIRPLLLARRADVLAHLRRHALEFSEDPSNEDPRFSRVRVRREVLPLLEDLSPGVVDHLCALADMLANPAGSADVDPDVLLLGRAQRLAIERARKLGRSVRVRVRGGRELGFPPRRG